MKKVLLATVLLAGSALASPTFAADLPRKAAPIVVPPPVFSWSGFYGGLNAGYGFDNDRDIQTTGQAAINVTNVAGGARPGSVRLEREGGIAGVQMGYNWQIMPNWLVGIEADFAGADINDTRNVVTIPLNGIGTLNNTFNSKLDYLGTVRARAGYVFDRTMVYATGGFAYGGVSNTVSFFGTPATGGLLQFVGSNRDLETGYTVGGGIEHFISNNFSVKAEYLYYDLGRTTVNVAVIPGNGGGGTGYNSRFDNEGHIVRVGLNYKFTGPIFGGR